MIRSTLVYPCDPLGSKVGGVETFLKGFIRHAPDDFDLEFVGVTSDRRRRPPRRVAEVRVEGRSVRVLPVLAVRDENRRGRVPVSLRFTAALAAQRVRRPGRVLLFNRIEPSLAFRRAPNPKIGFVHADIPRQCAGEGGEILWSRFPGLYERVERLAIGRLDAVFTSSRSTLDLYRGRYPGAGAKIEFLPSWIDAAVFGPGAGDRRREREALAAADRALTPEGPWILFAGRLQAIKAPLLALAGFDRLLARRGAATMIFIGAGNLAAPLRREIQRLGLRGRAVLVGEKSQAELAAFYRAADVLLLSSRSEAMPRCVLEALGSGTPVVTTDVGEVPRIVRPGETGEIVKGPSAEEIASALAKVLDGGRAYEPAACARSVSDFRPERVLAPVYARVRELDARARRPIAGTRRGFGRVTEEEP